MWEPHWVLTMRHCKIDEGSKFSTSSMLESKSKSSVPVNCCEMRQWKRACFYYKLLQIEKRWELSSCLKTFALESWYKMTLGNFRTRHANNVSISKTVDWDKFQDKAIVSAQRVCLAVFPFLCSLCCMPQWRLILWTLQKQKLGETMVWIPNNSVRGKKKLSCCRSLLGRRCSSV